MVGNKDISLKNKQYFVELVSDENTLLEIVKRLNRDNGKKILMRKKIR